MRDESFKLGIPAIHSRLPEGPNLEYDDGAPYIQDLVFRAEYDFKTGFRRECHEDDIDWERINTRVWGDVFRSTEGEDQEKPVLPHKRNGE